MNGVQPKGRSRVTVKESCYCTCFSLRLIWRDIIQKCAEGGLLRGVQGSGLEGTGLKLRELLPLQMAWIRKHPSWLLRTVFVVARIAVSCGAHGAKRRLLPG